MPFHVWQTWCTPALGISASHSLRTLEIAEHSLRIYCKWLTFLKLQIAKSITNAVLHAGAVIL